MPKISRMRDYFDVVVDVPEMGLIAGDTLSYDPRNPAEPYLVHRPIHVDAGSLLVALNEGKLEGATLPTLHRHRPRDPSVGIARPVLRLLRARDGRGA